MKKEEVLKNIQSSIIPFFSGKVFSNGNMKLGKGQLICNLTSATNCPSAKLGLCNHCKDCYARTEEKVFKTYKNRNIQVEKWLDVASVDEIIKMISAYITFYGNGKNAIKKIRLNEAGDFRNQDDVEKWDAVAKHFIKRGYQVYGWSARNDLDFSKVSFIVNASNVGTKGAIRRVVAVRQSAYDILPKKITFDSLDEETKNLVGNEKDYKDCKFIRCAGDCSKCHICQERKFKGVILVRSHGANALR